MWSISRIHVTGLAAHARLPPISGRGNDSAAACKEIVDTESWLHSRAFAIYKGIRFDPPCSAMGRRKRSNARAWFLSPPALVPERFRWIGVATRRANTKD